MELTHMFGMFWIAKATNDRLLGCGSKKCQEQHHSMIATQVRNQGRKYVPIFVGVLPWSIAILLVLYSLCTSTCAVAVFRCCRTFCRCSPRWSEDFCPVHQQSRRWTMADLGAQVWFLVVGKLEWLVSGVSLHVSSLDLNMMMLPIINCVKLFEHG